MRIPNVTQIHGITGMEQYVNLNDEQLMQYVAGGDSMALEALYDRYAPSVMGVVFRILQDRAAAEEVVQETFWRIWESASAFQTERGSFTSWLFTIARRQAIDITRRRKVRPQPARSEAEEKQIYTRPDPGPFVDDVAWLQIQRQQIRAALAKLSPEQYQVIDLAYFKGMTRKEIAEYTDTPLGTIHTRARLGLQKLRTVLVAEGVDA